MMRVLHMQRFSRKKKFLSIFFKELKAVYNLTSAKENKGIEDLFYKIAEALEKKQQDVETEYMNRIAKGSKLNKKKKEKGSCC